MNILHWPSSYPDYDRKDPYSCIFIEEHIRSLAGYCNNRVLFISSESTISRSKWHEKKTTVEHGTPVTRLYFNQDLNKQFLNIYIRVIILLHFLRLIFIDRFYPDLVHAHFFSSGTWARPFCMLFRVKMVVTEHWTALIGYPDIGPKRLAEAREVYEWASWVLPVSHHLEKGIINNTGAAISEKSTVIHNSVNTDLFTLKTTGRSPEKIISVARLDEQKDIPTMLTAFKMARDTRPNLTLSIIGGGGQAPYKKMAQDLGIASAVTFMGARSKEEIAAEMNTASLFLLSSISENSPCVIGEAHCCGLPVVATDVGGVKELVIEGGIVPAKAPEQLALKITDTLDREINRAVLAEQAVQTFGYSHIGKQLFDVYNHVLHH